MARPPRPPKGAPQRITPAINAWQLVRDCYALMVKLKSADAAREYCKALREYREITKLRLIKSQT